MVALRCTCEQGTNFWGEFWWIEGEHRWVFFDDEKTSETYAEQLTHCRGCGRSLERKGLGRPLPYFLRARFNTVGQANSFSEAHPERRIRSVCFPTNKTVTG